MSGDYTITPSGRTASLNCPHCGQAITYYDVENSSYYGCTACYSFFKYEYEGPPEVLRQFDKKYKCRIPIGARCVIDDATYTMVGYMRKNEDGEPQEWDEYVLFCAGRPYIILVAYAGDWLIVRKSPRDYSVTQITAYDHMVYDDGEGFHLYHSYKFNILYACGEFDWNVLGDEQMVAYEYMSNNKLLVNEILNGQSDWYYGLDMTAREVSRLFAGEGGLPNNEVDTITEISDRNKVLWNFTFIMVLLVIVAQIFISSSSPEKTVLNASYYAAQDSTAALNTMKPVITEPFELAHSGGVNIALGTDVDNEWAELSLTMVNEQTGREYESVKTVEYYHGYESGEYWSEGGRDEEISFSDVPSGRYHLNIYPFSDIKKNMNISVQVFQNKHFYSNMWLMLALLMVWPVLLLLYNNATKKSIW